MKKTIIKTTALIALVIWLSPVFAQNQLTGTVDYHDDPNLPVPEVSIQLIDMNNNVLQTALTNDNGEYFFDSIPNGSYYLASSTLLDPGQVTLQDAFLIMMHLFGLYDFTEYEFAASDVNGSGTITWSDYFIVIINYLLQGQPFPTGEWQFESVQIDFMARDFGTTDTARVWATGSGDVEGVWVPVGRNLALVTGTVVEPVNISRQTTSIEITSGYPELISGFNLNINYPSHLMTITGVEGPDGNLNYAIEQGVVKILWMDESEHAGSLFYGDHLCTLLVNQKVGIGNEQSATMTLQENGMILDESGLPVEGAEIRLPSIKSGEINVVNEASCYPNPVVNQLNIRLANSLNTTGLLCIYDISGKLTQQVDLNQFTSRAGVIEINTTQLSPGSYTYVVKTGQQDQVTSKGRFFKSE
jgi:hypothetical protein